MVWNTALPRDKKERLRSESELEDSFFDHNFSRRENMTLSNGAVWKILPFWTRPIVENSPTTLEYEILTENYQIRLYGKPQEIKTFLEATDKIFTKSTTITMIQDDLDNIKKVVEKHTFDFGNPNQRLYYNKNKITYIPNVNGEEAKKVHFQTTKFLFEKIKKEFEKSYELKEIKN